MPKKKPAAEPRELSALSAPKKERANNKFTTEQVVAAIQTAKGLVSQTARLLGCDPDTVRSYAKRYPDVQQALAEEREAMTDVAELALYNQLTAGAGWAVCFYLKTQGKSRGYVERTEHSGPEGGAIPIAVTSQLSDEALRAGSEAAYKAEYEKRTGRKAPDL